MTTEQIIEIIKAAHSLGAKKITISDSGIGIEWDNSVTISSPVYYPVVKPEDVDKTTPISEPVMIYGVGMGQQTARTDSQEPLTTDEVRERVRRVRRNWMQANGMRG